MTPVRKRLLFWTPFALALVGALAWLLRPAAVTVELLAVDRGPLAVSISDEGGRRHTCATSTPCRRRSRAACAASNLKSATRSSPTGP